MLEFIIILALAGGVVWYLAKHGKDAAPRSAATKPSDLPKWAHGFILFHAGSKAQLAFGSGGAYRATSPLTGKVLPPAEARSVANWLPAYAAEASVPESEVAKMLPKIIEAMPSVLRFELAAYNSPAALAAMFEEQDPDRPRDEVHETASLIHREIQRGNPEVMQFEDMAIVRRLERCFEKLHGEPLSSYSERVTLRLEQMLDHDEQSIL